MPNLANFSFTKQADVFSPETVLVGTAVHLEGGTRDEGTFFQGNGIVISVSALSLTVEMFNLHSQEFETRTIAIEEFLDDSVLLQVLTIEDGTGSEGTGAVPADLTPPGEVTDLSAVVTHEQVQLSYVFPTDNDFDHVKIYQDGLLVGDNVTQTTFTISNLSELTSYDFLVETVDTSGNRSSGMSISVTTDQAPDTTPPGEVTSLQATNVTATTADLTYIMPTDADFSHVQIFDGATLLADNIVNTAYTVTGLTANTEYTLTVKTVDVSGNVSTGASVTFTTQP